MSTIDVVYNLIKSQNFLPGSIRHRIGSKPEHPDQLDTVRFTTPDGRVYVVEYHTAIDGKNTLSTVYDIIEIDDVKNGMIKG